MLSQPFLGAHQKLTTALLGRDADYRERTTAIRSTYMRESQKVERFRLLVVLRFPFGSEASEEQQPSFPLGQSSRLNLAKAPVTASEGFQRLPGVGN